MRDIEQLRRDFELSLIFNKYKLTSPGCLQRFTPTGLYIDNHIEAAWRGYQMAADNFEGQMKRFDPERYIPNGMVTQFYDDLTLKKSTGVDAVKGIFKAVLKISADSPN